MQHKFLGTAPRQSIPDGYGPGSLRDEACLFASVKEKDEARRRKDSRGLYGRDAPREGQAEAARARGKGITGISEEAEENEQENEAKEAARG